MKIRHPFSCHKRTLLALLGAGLLTGCALPERPTVITVQGGAAKAYALLTNPTDFALDLTRQDVFAGNAEPCDMIEILPEGEMEKRVYEVDGAGR